MPEKLTREILLSLIDQTNLNQLAPRAEVEAFTREAVAQRFFAICVYPTMIPVVKPILAGSATKLATVISFPLGMGTPAGKRVETEDALSLGVDEIDVVINVAAARENDFAYIEKEITEVRRASSQFLLKTIIEISQLTEAQIVGAARAAEAAGSDIVKTSTGFKGIPDMRATTGADIALIRSVLKPETGIKASGGIRTLAESIAVYEAGATRIGTSSGVKIMQEFDSQQG